MSSERAGGLRVTLEALQVGQQVRRRLVPKLTVFLQCHGDDSVHLWGQGVVQSSRFGRMPMQDTVINQRRSIRIKGRPSGGHFVKYCAQRKKIGADVSFFSLRLLRRHVTES